MFEARSCHTLLVRQAARCRLAPRSRFHPRLSCVILFKGCCAALDQSKVQCGVTGWETQCGYAVGAWGNLCQANLPCRGQTAAHGQITERKYSVAQSRCWNDNFAQNRPEGSGEGVVFTTVEMPGAGIPQLSSDPAPSREWRLATIPAKSPSPSGSSHPCSCLR